MKDIVINHKNTQDGRQVTLCDKCGKGEALPQHSCPYDEEINDDDSENCSCCEQCMQDCVDEI